LGKSESWKTWIIVIGLLIFAGLASAAWLWLSNQESTESERQEMVVESESEPITIQVKDYVLGNDLLQLDFISKNVDGQQVDAGMAFLIISGIVIAVVGATGLLIALVTFFFNRGVTKVYGDESYQAATITLDQRQKTWIKDHQQEQPRAAEVEPEQRSRWSFLATSLLIIIIVWIAGLIAGFTLLKDTTWEIAGLEVSAATVVNLTLILTTIIILYAVARSHEPDELDGSTTDNQPVNWGTIWVILSGLLIVGAGTGAAIALRAAGGG
jgi:Flp pilus assembly protein TadB